MPSSLSAPPSQGIDAEDSNQKRSSFAASEQAAAGQSSNAIAHFALDFQRKRSVPEIIAKKVIELAKGGERDPERICDYALVNLRFRPHI
jgi:hypothetical protein